MKGKGKGEKGGKGNQTSDDCPLQFPSLKILELFSPKFQSVINQDEEEAISLDDLDALQLELDNLLADVAKRMRLIECEIQLIDGWTDSRGKESLIDRKDKVGMSPASYTSQLTPNTPLRSPSEPATPSGKRERSGSGKGSSTELRPSKRIKLETSRLPSRTVTIGKDKGKVQLLPPQTKDSSPDDECDKKLSELMKSPRNLIQNRFWAMVELYSGEIKKKDIEFLEEQIVWSENIDDYVKNKSPISANDGTNGNKASRFQPSRRCSISSLPFSSPSTASSNHPPVSSTNCLDSDTEDTDDDQSAFGLLTKRLIRGLIDDKSNKKLNAVNEIEVCDFTSMSSSSIAKHLRINNPLLLEKKIRKELLDLGILDLEDLDTDEDEGDEVVCELRRQQVELRHTSQQNACVLKHLLVESKHELRKQELKAKILALDNEIVESYKKIQLSRSKKKQLSKKERDAFYKLLDDRKIICRQLYAIYSAS